MARIRIGSQTRGDRPGQAITGCLALFGLIFAVGGGIFAFVVAKDFLTTVKARGWEQVPATLLKAEVVVDRKEEHPFALEASFSYRFGGREQVSHRYALRKSSSDSYEKIALRIKSLRSHSELVAYVDPETPSKAVLNPGSLASGLLILFPLIFVAVGAGVLIAAMRTRRPQRAGAKPTVESISSKPTMKGAGATAGLAIGIVLTLAGFGLLYPLGIHPITRAHAAKSWTETPCRIIWASVKSHDSDDGTTYSIDIFYSYEIDGQQHRSNRYGFIAGSSSGSAAKRKVVAKYRKNKAPVCYVDPDLPERAVLKRELGAGILLSLIPAALILIGLLVSFSSARKRMKLKAARDEHSRATPARPTEPVSAAGPRTLSPGRKRLGTAMGLLFFALFWNGIVFGFLFNHAWLGEGGLFMKLFSIPFILVGIVVAFAFLHRSLALLNPQAILTLDPGDPQLGVPTSLKWRFKGSTGRLRNLRMIIRGVERASYRRGTDTVTDTNTFYSALLTEENQAMTMHGGGVEFTLPHDLMYSLELANNAIIWRIEVTGEIAVWPDVDDKYELTVRPYPMTRPNS